MNEVGVDISQQKPKIITKDIIKGAEKSIYMGCISKAEFLIVFINNVIDWGIEDPKNKQIETVRQIRDSIEKRVSEIAESLEKSHNV